MPAAMEARYNLKSPGRPQQAAFEPRARRAGPGAGPGSGWGGRALVQQRAELRPGLSAMGGAKAGRGAPPGAEGRASRAGPVRHRSRRGREEAGRVRAVLLMPAAQGGSARGAWEALELSLSGVQSISGRCRACACVSTPFCTLELLPASVRAWLCPCCQVLAPRACVWGGTGADVGRVCAVRLFC